MNRTIRRFSIGSALALAALLATSRDAHPQPAFDYGDAPEDALAYPSTGGTGIFPTYDDDECFADGDAGLLTPTAFTIVGGAAVPCPHAGSPVALGPSCQMATIQANVVNNMPAGVTGYINVLFDWDRNGAWGGAWSCGSSSAPEHAVVDDPIPPGFSGVWTSPPFKIGSPGGVYVWMRLEIAERAVGPNWDGSGSFEDGESEDYLVEVLLPSIPIQQESWGRVKTLYR